MTTADGESEPRRPGAAAALALAVARGDSIAKAAQKLEVPYATAKRWARTRKFREAVDKLRRQATDRTLGKIVSAGTRAVETLVELTRPGNPEAIRLGAARSILDKLPDLTYFADLTERVAEVEKAQRREENRHAKRY